MGNAMNAADIFAALNVIMSLRLPLILIPEGVTHVATIMVSMDRVRNFLLLDENSKAVQYTNSKLTNEARKENIVASIIGKYKWPSSVNNTNATINDMNNGSYTTNSFSLFCHKKINFEKGKIYAIVGTVGCGKTCFLNAILDELEIKTNTIQNISIVSSCKAISNRINIGYVPQTPFIMSGTLKENILMNHEMKKSHYENIISACALTEDIKLLPKFEETEIGERGVTLSGGQKQRVSLARALYSQPDLLILDDPLAAVDSGVAQHIFKNAIFEHQILEESPKVQDKIKLNQNSKCIDACSHKTPTQLKKYEFDSIIYINDGVIEGTDSFKNLYASNKNFAKLFSFEDDENKKNDKSSDDKLSSRATQTVQNNSPDTEHLGLIQNQHREKGSFQRDIIFQYVKGMGYFRTTLAVLVCTICYGLMAGSDRFLAYWVNWSEKKQEQNGGHIDLKDSLPYILTYAALTLGYMISLILTSSLFTDAGVNSSRRLHYICVKNILHAPMSWYEETPAGRILSRFSTDISMVDLNVPRFFDNFMQFTCVLLALIFLVIFLVPLIAPILLLAGSAFGYVTILVNRAARKVGRERNNLMSPIQSILGEIVCGRVVIRAMNLELFNFAIDAWNKENFLLLSLTAWAQTASYSLSTVISSGTAIIIVMQRQSFNPSGAALALTYSYLIPYFLLHYCFIINQLNNCLTSLERLLRYASDAIPQEPEWTFPSDPLLQNWPQNGSVSFNNVCMRYRPCMFYFFLNFFSYEILYLTNFLDFFFEILFQNTCCK
eukprot:GSMAST32.ASY1.ANO1.2816.1 assembled CDS